MFVPHAQAMKAAHARLLAVQPLPSFAKRNAQFEGAAPAAGHMHRSKWCGMWAAEGLARAEMWPTCQAWVVCPPQACAWATERPAHAVRPFLAEAASLDGRRRLGAESAGKEPPR
jgi:hypothetical protein